MPKEIVLYKIGEIKTSPISLWGITFTVYLSVEFFLLTILFFLEKQGVIVEIERSLSKTIISALFIVILHELSHFIAYHWLCKIDRNDIYLGFHWRWLVPFCGTKSPVSIACYRITLITPLIITGCICMLLFCFFLSEWTVKALSFALAISSKDIVDFLKLRKFDKNNILSGHPEIFGLDRIFERKYKC